MKGNPNIDELLNSFIDGELTQRQHTEVQRLITHDAQIAQRLQELEKCKMLVNSLPRAQAPAEMANEIKASLERRTLLGQEPVRFDERQGVRHLLGRKVVAAAAMIALMALLAGVVYTIVGPEKGLDRPVAVGDAGHQPPRQVEGLRPGPSVATAAATGFNGRLELKTSNLIAVDQVINRAIEDNGLVGCISSRSEGNKSIYAFNCSREALNLLLADLESVWAEFGSATLFVDTGQVAGEVVVNAVTTEQINEIVNQGTSERRIKAAKYFAVLNDMAENLPGKEIFLAAKDGKDDLPVISRPPKPILTSDEKTIKKPAGRAEDEQKVHLTIVVVSSK